MSSESKDRFNITSGMRAGAKARFPLFRMSAVGSFALGFGRQALAWLLVALMIPLGVGDVMAQTAPPPPPPDQAGPPPQGYDAQQGYDAPPPQNYNALSPDQVDQLVAPIALYPDSLVAQILAASTFPTQVVEADRFVQSHQGVSPDQLGPMVDGMQWDPSVKALVAFPTVLSNLDQNLEWTTQLGNAYYNQPQDVMSAVQVMRQRAYDAGNLRTNQQLNVAYQPNNIVIAPANPAVVYVPYYNPWVVYGSPIVAYPVYYAPPPPPGLIFGVGLALGFGIGIALASWNHWGWGWHNWGCGWGSRTIVYNRNVYISRSTTVINHGYYGRFDRNPAARSYNRNIAARAPNYHDYNHGPNNFNHPANAGGHPGAPNNFNHAGAPNNYNHPGTPAANHPPAANYGGQHAPSSNFARPANGNTYNRPTTNPGHGASRPPTTAPGSYARPAAPSNTGNFSRPATPSNGNFNRPPSQPQSHPQAPQGHPQSAPQSHPQPHSSGNEGGGHPRR